MLQALQHTLIHWDDHAEKNQIWFMSLTAATLVGLTGVLPMVMMPFFHQRSDGKGDDSQGSQSLRLMLSFAVGGLLGDVFLHLLPEAWSFVERSTPNTNPEAAYHFLGLWVVCGLFTFVALESVFNSAVKSESNLSDGTSHAQTNGDCGKDRPRTLQEKNVAGYLNLFANGIDNFTHGLAVAASFLVGTKIGVLTTFAIIIHEVPHEFGDFAILMKSGFSKWEAIKAQLSTASVGIIGAIVALCAESSEALGAKTAWILPFTAGGFIHIAMVSILPDLLREENPRESCKQMLCVASGIGVMALVNCLAA